MRGEQKSTTNFQRVLRGFFTGIFRSQTQLNEQFDDAGQQIHQFGWTLNVRGNIGECIDHSV